MRLDPLKDGASNQIRIFRCMRLRITVASRLPILTHHKTYSIIRFNIFLQIAHKESEYLHLYHPSLSQIVAYEYQRRSSFEYLISVAFDEEMIA